MILLKVSEVFSKPGGLCWEVGLGGIDGIPGFRFSIAAWSGEFPKHSGS